MSKRELEQFKKWLEDRRKIEFNPNMCEVLDYFIHQSKEEIEYAELEEQEGK